MKTYDIFIGGEKCKLYLGAEPVNLYFDSSRVYGKLSYDYDEATHRFTVQIDELSDRAKLLMEQGKLRITVTTKSSANVYCKGRARTEGDPSRRTTRMYHPRWTRDDGNAPYFFVGAEDDIFKFYVSDIGVPRNVRRIDKMQAKYGNPKRDKMFFDVRFYLQVQQNNNRLNHRLLKTICEPFRIEYDAR